jgi:hypothetical protein
MVGGVQKRYCPFSSQHKMEIEHESYSFFFQFQISIENKSTQFGNERSFRKSEVELSVVWWPFDPS